MEALAFRTPSIDTQERSGFRGLVVRARLWATTGSEYGDLTCTQVEVFGIGAELL